jgi:2-polyprenyl-3-methyl-5-hydroxy-6-metoxy-1,4-benzoquinol methylase
MQFKQSNFTKYLNRHEYPSLLHRFPVLIRAIYLLNYILTLRNWYVNRSLKKLEKELQGGFSFLDAGCGMGDFSIGIAKRNNKFQVTGIDFTDSNISIAEGAANSLHLTNVEFKQGDLTVWTSEMQYDLVLCNSTLQFIKNDILALSNIHKSLRPNGILLLYIPIAYKRYFPWTESILQNHLSDFFYKYHDDFLMHRYSDTEIIKKVEGQNYKVKSIEYAYGKYGAIAFELYSLLLATINKMPLLFSIVISILYMASILPIQIILMLIDICQTKEEGNGILILAEKNEMRSN